MGHYDNCRDGYCGKCGAAPGNIRADGTCVFCVPEPRKVTATEDKVLRKAAKGKVVSPEFTDRDVNLLSSCSNWLETRSNARSFRGDAALMREYAADLRAIRDRIAPVAVPKPVTLDEIFGKGK